MSVATLETTAAVQGLAQALEDPRRSGEQVARWRWDVRRQMAALRDALAVLTAEQYEALATLAAFDNDVAAAAEALGMKYHGFYYRVLSGRNKIKAVWFGDETPVTSLLTGETCRVGHSRAEHGIYREDAGVWACRVCNRNAARRRSANRTRGVYSTAS